VGEEEGKEQSLQASQTGGAKPPASTRTKHVSQPQPMSVILVKAKGSQSQSQLPTPHLAGAAVRQQGRPHGNQGEALGGGHALQVHHGRLQGQGGTGRAVGDESGLSEMPCRNSSNQLERRLPENTHRQLNTPNII
jgi:hypothetical protein